MLRNTDTDNDEYIFHKAVDLLPQESDPVYIKLVRLAQSRGIKAYIVNKIAEGVEGIWFTRKGMSIILIDASLEGADRRFVMAHELGHAVLHSNANKMLYFRDKAYRGRIEYEADQFAKRLLNLLERKRKQERTGRSKFQPKPEPEPDPPTGAGVVREYIVTAAVSEMAA